MIDEKKLIEERPEWLNPDCVGNEEYNKGWNDCNKYWCNTIERQPKVGEWIPCSERIPEEGKRVLVWFEYFRYGNYNKPFQTWGISYTIDEAWSGFVNGQSGWKDLKILAWMPLPEPFKETIQDCKDSKRLAEREKFFRD